MIRLGDTTYRLCLLDTNAVSEMVKDGLMLGHFRAWSTSEEPYLIPCFSPFTVAELRRKDDVYEQFLERFGQVPCMLLKSHGQLLDDEISSYPNPSAIDPTLLGFTPLGGDGNDLQTVLSTAYGTDELLQQERMWNEAQEEIVEGIRSLVPNFPPQRDKYTHSEIRLFVEAAGIQQLALQARDFVEGELARENAVDVDAFPSLKVSLYTVFHKFYADRTRRPSRSDAFDIMIAAPTPYVEAVITESHQAEALRKTMRHDDFLRELRVFSLRDFRRVPVAYQ